MPKINLIMFVSDVNRIEAIRNEATDAGLDVIMHLTKTGIIIGSVSSKDKLEGLSKIEGITTIMTETEFKQSLLSREAEVAQ